MKSIVIKKIDLNTGFSEEICYAVNNMGNGLFRLVDGNFKQIIGTCDFHASNRYELVKKLNSEPDDYKYQLVRNCHNGW